MKINFSLPTNQEFFNRYANLTPTLIKLGVIAQVISAGTEIGILYSLILARATEFTPDHAPTIAIVGAIIGTAFLEVGLRKFTPYSIRAFIHKRLKGLDLAMTISILIVNLALLGASGALSFEGSKELVRNAAPKPLLKSTDVISDALSDNRSHIIKQYDLDAVSIEKQYVDATKAKKQYYQSKIDAANEKIKSYEKRERAKGLSYATKKKLQRNKIQDYQIELNGILSNLTEKKNRDLADMRSTKKNRIASIESEYKSDKASILKSNDDLLSSSQNTTSKYGNALAYFTIICILVFLFSVVIDELNKKGSGIEEIAQPNQYFFSDSILNEFLNMLSDKYNYYLRTGIKKIADKTPAPPMPTAPLPLYDLAQALPQRVLLKIDAPASKQLILANHAPTLPSEQAADFTASTSKENLQDKILQYMNAYHELEKCNLHTQANEMKLKADDVIKAYLGTNATNENVTNLRTHIIGFLHGLNTNPFAQHHRNPIGFNKAQAPVMQSDDASSDGVSSVQLKTTIRKSYNDTLDDTPSNQNQRICAHCNSTYTYKHHKQKYCTDDCRKRAWEERTGKQLKLKKRK